MKGKYSNNEAEYLALISALHYCYTNGIEPNVIYGDSQLVVKQALGEYKVRKQSLKPYVDEIQYMLPQIGNPLLVWIPRGDNKEADKLSRIYER